MILHVAGLDKFIPPFVKLVKEEFKEEKHQFWFTGFEALRRFFIRRVGHLVTDIEGDVDLARQCYDAERPRHECIVYLSNVVDPKMMSKSGPASDREGWSILLGNSAGPSSNYIEALERLLPLRDQAIKKYSPLSYGDQNHAKKVISQGKEWFGDKFVPMTDLIPFKQYWSF